MANGQNGLVEVKRILQEQLVHSRTAWICLPALRDAIFAISLWVNVITAAGQQDALNSQQQPGNAILALVKRNKNRSDSRGMECGKIRRQGSLVVR